MISRSGDVCSEGSWVFYNTRNVCSIISFLSLHSLSCCFRLNPLRTPHAFIESSRVGKMRQYRSLFSSHGTSLHRETTATGCPYSNVITRTPVLPYHQRSALLTVGRFPETHNQRTRISLLFSMHSMTAREGDANLSRPALSKIVRRRQGKN